MASPLYTPADFLTALWGADFPAPVLIWTMPGRRSHWLRAPAEANRDWGKRNIYMGVALPPADKELRDDNRVESNEAIGLSGLHDDLDYQSEGAHKKPNLPTQEEASEFIFTVVDPKPNLVVLSGHGYQPWRLFKGGPQIFKSAAERTAAQELIPFQANEAA